MTGRKPAKKAAPQPAKQPAKKAAPKPAPVDQPVDQPLDQPADQPGTRFAAFNRTLGKFIGGTRDTRREAELLAEKITEAGHVAEIREV